jgi:V/A-type H+-transporting ATPase subunit I
VRFAGLEGTPNEIITKLREQCSALRERNGHLREHITGELVPLHDKLLLLCDHYSQEVQALKVQHNFLFTSHTFFVSGYVLADQEENLRKRLDESARVVDIKLSEPGPDDRVPIHLENNKLVRPFSLITELYGRPQYTEFDPTPLLAPFFVLFFAVCLGDAGYGLILAVGSYIALKKFQIYGGARKLLQILFLGGLANIVVGLLTGAIFGIESGNLPGLLRVLVLFSPTEQVMPFLYIAFALGLIQVLFGLSIKMAHNIRHGKTTSALLDQGLWMLFLMALAPIVYKHIFGGEVSEGINSLALTSSKILVVALIFTQGRDTKIIVLRPIVGLLRLYDTVGYFSDVLSYARLMALGLATAYLAIAFNVMAELSLQIPFGIGYVLATFILVFSHMFNLLVNCLGAFVHSLRLQYLEFFSKFFIGGGKAFVPFIEERQHTIVQPYLNETS